MSLKSQIKRLIHLFGPVYHHFFNRPKPLAEVSPEHYLSVLACVKNEGRYLREWIEYHLWAGVEHFYLYDNGSTDNTQEVLAPYVASGIVTCHYYAGERGPKNQLSMYNDAVVRYKYCTKWLAIIDADEFITLSDEGKKQFGEGGGLISFFKAYEKYPAVGINWVWFDGGGHEKMPESGYVIDNYTRAQTRRNIKSVVQPLEVIFVSVHHCEYRRLQKAVDDNFKPIKSAWIEPGSTHLIRINHYYSKSKEEYMVKIGVRKWPDNTERTYNQDHWAFPEWQADSTMKEAAAALRAKGVPETYGNQS